MSNEATNEKATTGATPPSCAPSNGSAANVAGQTWSNTPPNQEGWWWIGQDGAKCCIVRVRRQRAYGDRLCIMGDGWTPIEEINSRIRWAGPIPEPVEPQNK